MTFHALWMAALYGVPSLWVFHWGLDVLQRESRNATARLVAVQYGMVLIMLAAAFAIQVVPLGNAMAIMVYGVVTPQIMILALTAHLWLEIMGWTARRRAAVIAAYIWVIPAIGLIWNKVFASTSFYRQDYWAKPYYNRPFHVGMDLAVLMTALLVVGFGLQLRTADNPNQRKKIAVLFWGGVVSTVIHVLFGSFLPKFTPPWLPPFPYFAGTMVWLIALRYAVSRYELLPLRLERYRTVFTLSPVPILMTDAQGHVVEMNPAAVALLGGRTGTIRDLFAPDIRGASSQAYHMAFAQRRAIKDWEVELNVGMEAPRPVVIHGDFIAVGASTYGLLAIQDMTLERQKQAALTRMAYHDALTGLPNAAQFHKSMDEAMSGQSLAHVGFALMMVDLDNFKWVNDTWGHQVGNQALVSIAERLGRGRRADDVLGRFGGDEFMVLLAHIPSAEAAQDIAHRMLESFVEPITLGGGHQFHVTLSMGISLYPEHGRDAETLIKAADAALYAAKRAGKNRALLFDAAAVGESDLPRGSMA